MLLPLLLLLPTGAWQQRSALSCKPSCCKALLPLLLLLTGLSTDQQNVCRAAQVAEALLMLLLLLTGTVPALLSPHTPASRTLP